MMKHLLAEAEYTIKVRIEIEEHEQINPNKSFLQITQEVEEMLNRFPEEFLDAIDYDGEIDDKYDNGNSAKMNITCEMVQSGMTASGLQDDK